VHFACSFAASKSPQQECTALDPCKFTPQPCASRSALRARLQKYIQCTQTRAELTSQCAVQPVTSSDHKESHRAGKATATPWWKGLQTLIQFRTVRNYMNPDWFAPRLADKLLFSFIIALLYLGIGDDFSPENVFNIPAIFFMWIAIPSFGAAACDSCSARMHGA
jgi:hypothetical protein